MDYAALWQLAIRALLRRPLRTLLTVLGLVVAVSSMLLFLSLGQGLQGQLRTELRSVGPDLQVARRSSGLSLLPSPDLPATVVQTLNQQARALGIVQVTPVAAQIKQDFDPTHSAVYYGLPVTQGIQALFPSVEVSRGRLLRPSDEGQPVAVLGASAAHNLGLDVGGEFNVTRRVRARIVGVLRPQHNLTDTFTFLPLTSVQRALGTGDQLSFIALRLRDPGQAQAVAARLQAQLDLQVSTRDDVLRSAGRVLRSADVLSLGLSLVALIVGGLAVTNTMLMALHERTQEFATMRAIGAGPSFIRQLVLTESLLLALLGWVGSLLTGVPGAWAINRLTRHIAGIDGSALTPGLLLLTLGLSLLLGVLAGWGPAWRAGRIQIARGLTQP